ncbi:MFS transporter [Streptomyces sp. NPDC001315]|uniref:MFS transporter n=1 Tax=Streptomyces sp. NPDC001315 TaxID=3364562 RepID=UPI00369F6857
MNQRLAGALSDRLPRPLVFSAGLAFFSVGYLGLGLIHSPWMVFVVLPLYGGFNACTDGVGKAWISTVVPDRQQGTAQGLYQGGTGVAVLLAGLWAGLAWDTNGRLPLLMGWARLGYQRPPPTADFGRRRAHPGHRALGPDRQGEPPAQGRMTGSGQVLTKCRTSSAAGDRVLHDGCMTTRFRRIWCQHQPVRDDGSRSVPSPHLPHSSRHPQALRQARQRARSGRALSPSLPPNASTP